MFPSRHARIHTCSRKVLDRLPIRSYVGHMPRKLSSDSWERVGGTIKAMREMRGMTVDDLASRVQKSRPYLANIEAGRKPLTAELLPRIATALGVPQVAILDLIDGKDAA